jgi:hypothetical protein
MYSNQLTAFDLFRAFTSQLREIHGNGGLAPWSMIEEAWESIMYEESPVKTTLVSKLPRKHLLDMVGFFDLSFV